MELPLARYFQRPDAHRKAGLAGHAAMAAGGALLAIALTDNALVGGWGLLLVLPCCWMLFTGWQDRQSMSRNRLLRAWVMIALGSIISSCIFLQNDFTLLVVQVPIVLIYALYLGAAGNAIGLLALFAIAYLATVTGHGPISMAAGGAAEQGNLLQLFLASNLAISVPVILQIRKLTQSANSKADFLASMSHDIRTPMNGVIGFADLLKQGELTEEQRRSVDHIAESGQTMVRLLNDILDFSRMEAGGLELEQGEVDLHDELAYSAALFGPRADKKGITLDCIIDPDVPGRIVGDSLRIRQVLLNLVGNAVKFTDHGKVTLSAYAQRGPLGTQLVIEVADSGIGIPPEALEHIFNRYEQADAKTARERGGTGLGLAISSQLVGLMEGQIDVKSELGQGTIITVQIPVSELPSREVHMLHKQSKARLYAAA